MLYKKQMLSFTVFLFKDLQLPVLRDRLTELSKSAVVLNTNMQTNLPPKASWMASITEPYSIITSPCQNVRVALLGLLSDEPKFFRDNTFKTVPIANVLESYSDMYQKLVLPQRPLADICIPLTHQFITRDQELAKHMLEVDRFNTHGLIIGGHEHEPYDQWITQPTDDTATTTQRSVRITKSGTDANAASLIDLVFTLPDSDEDAGHGTNNNNWEEEQESSYQRPQLAEIQYDLVELTSMAPSFVIQTIVDQQMSVVKGLEDEPIIDATTHLAPGVVLSSERTRYQPTTVGGTFGKLLKEELEVDAAMINGASIKGGRTYSSGKMSYADLKKELPFPTKIVIVPMERFELQNAIDFSRTHIEAGTDVANVPKDQIPRRGYLQVDSDFEEHGSQSGSPSDVLQVALPRNLLAGFCDIHPLMEIGKRLKRQGLFPGPDDYLPAIDLIVRHSCKNRWFQIFQDHKWSFEELDLNHDGILDRQEVKQMMKQLLGHEPADFVVDDMIASIDSDENGAIDMGEFSHLLASMEREYQRDQEWRKF
jgi:2',3'-cyclic-nucleotide 2'-phosphodiesterase (5'-nucleotidase family)